MTNRASVSPLALTAIAAVLALAPTPVLAQEAAAPDPAPAAVVIDSPAPIVIPEMRSAPVVQALPETPVAVEPVAATAPVARAAPRKTARIASTTAAAPVAAAAIPTTATPVTAPAPASVGVPTEVPQVTAIAEAPPVAAPAQNDNTALELGLLGLVALGGAGAYGLARRRRRATESVAEYRDESMAAPAPTVTVATSAWTPAVAAAIASERCPIVVRSTGAVIPAGPLPTGPALATLFEAMATAAPDADNPFTAVKRRRQRVRWLMKQHEYALRRGDDRPFDFRSYTAAPQPTRMLVDA